MDQRPNREFGKRRPAPIPTPQPVKRSGHVALLLMGSLAVGGGAYALMPGGNCEPKAPGMAAPSLPQTGAGCPPGGSSSGGGHGSSGGAWSRSSFFSGGSAANPSPSGTASDSASGNVTRGGFGSFAQAFTAHFSGGG
jgi:hypothetical protein